MYGYTKMNADSMYIGIFKQKKTITVFIKLYGGLDLVAGCDDYDPETGICLAIVEGARLKKALKAIGLKKRGAIAYFINGQKASLNDKLNENDMVFCMKPVTGG